MKEILNDEKKINKLCTLIKILIVWELLGLLF